MNPTTLRAICFKYTYHFLLRGTWDNCLDNPFSYMPSSIVQELLSRMLPPDLVTRDIIVRSHLLLTSGRLHHVNLLYAGDFEDYFLLLRMLSRGCQNVRSLSLPRRYPRPGSDEEQSLGELFQNCTNLEVLHSHIPFDPQYLGNNTKLRELKLHLNRSGAVGFSRDMSPDLLQSLGGIRVFALCQIKYFLSAYEKNSILSLAVMLLDNCPELTSMGFFDSSMALKELYGRDMRTLQSSRTFQLRRCYWAPERDLSQFAFCETIRVAVSTCPQVEVLVVEVHAAGCLQHLKTLRKLTTLHIHFDDCGDKYGQEFYSLLREVGPQLQGLSITGSWKKLHNLNLISDSCPILSSLQLRCGMTAVEPAQPHTQFLHLKRLSVFECDRECLLFLLSNCVHLKVVCLDRCKVMEDGLLHEILRRNSLAELEVAHFNSSSLSIAGLTTFVQSARNLEKLSLGSTASLSHSVVLEYVRALNPSVVYSPWDYHKLADEFSLKCGL